MPGNWTALGTWRHRKAPTRMDSILARTLQRRPGGMAALLIVDDETGLLTAMRQYFRGCGYEVDCAETEAEATALIAQRCYDCVICDLNLTAARCGEGDTIIADAVRRCPDTRSILITAYEPPGGMHHADCCLQKPQRLQALEATVRRLLVESGR